MKIYDDSYVDDRREIESIFKKYTIVRAVYPFQLSKRVQIMRHKGYVQVGDVFKIKHRDEIFQKMERKK